MALKSVYIWSHFYTHTHTDTGAFKYSCRSKGSRACESLNLRGAKSPKYFIKYLTLEIG